MNKQEQNLADLTNAAKLKLEAQKKQTEAPSDIYAEFKEEESVPSIQKAPNVNMEAEEELYEENPIDEEDYPLFPNGPYMSQVSIWKKQYGEGRVLHAQIVEKHFVFRTLNRYEYKQLIALDNVDSLMREEMICNTCTLFPRNYDFKTMATGESGYPSTLAQIILEASGFTKEYGIEIL